MTTDDQPINPGIMRDIPDTLPHWEVSGPRAENMIDDTEVWTDTDQESSKDN